MTEKKDGGPAYPFHWKDFQPGTGEEVTREQYSGMTLRDYFAGQAMIGLMAQAERGFCIMFEDLSKSSYVLADAMLKEREK